MRRAQRRAVVEHNVYAIVEVVAAVDPPLKRGGHETSGDVLVARIGKSTATGPNSVLEHGRADVIPVDDRQVGRLVEGAGRRVHRLENLRVLVVDHRLGGVDLAAQQGQHVEALAHQIEVGTGIKARLAGSGQQLELVAPAPVTDNLSCEVGWIVDARVGPGHLEGAGALEDLGHVDDVGSLFTRDEGLRDPRDSKVHRAGSQLLLGHDVHTALENRHVKAVVPVDAVVHGRVVARKLGLGNPLKLQAHRVDRIAVAGSHRNLVRSASCR